VAEDLHADAWWDALHRQERRAGVAGVIHAPAGQLGLRKQPEKRPADAGRTQGRADRRRKHQAMFLPARAGEQQAAAAPWFYQVYPRTQSVK